MPKFYENTAVYNAAKDATTVCTLTVVCHPGQVEAVRTAMRAVSESAGVYHASFDSVALPTPELAGAQGFIAAKEAELAEREAKVSEVEVAAKTAKATKNAK